MTKADIVERLYERVGLPKQEVSDVVESVFELIKGRLEKGEKVEPNHPMLKIFRATTYFFQGRSDEAIGMMSEVLEQHPEMDGIRPLYAEFLAGAGRVDEARAQLTDDALSAARSDHDTAFWVGSTYALIGDKDLAFKWLNKAVKLGNENRPHFEHSKNLDPIRDDPRFAELLEKIGQGH